MQSKFMTQGISVVLVEICLLLAEFPGLPVLHQHIYTWSEIQPVSKHSAQSSGSGREKGSLICPPPPEPSKSFLAG